MKGLKKYLSIDNKSLRKEYREELRRERKIDEFKSNLI